MTASAEYKKKVLAELRAAYDYNLYSNAETVARFNGALQNLDIETPWYEKTDYQFEGTAIRIKGYTLLAIRYFTGWKFTNHDTQKSFKTLKETVAEFERILGHIEPTRFEYITRFFDEDNAEWKSVV